MLEQTQRGIKPLTANVAMSVQLYSILHPLPDWINNLSFVIFDIWALTLSPERPDVKKLQMMA